MGFADYLTRNHSGKPTPESEDNKKFGINTIHEMKHACLKHRIEPNNAVKLTGCHTYLLESKQIEQNDVTHDKQNTRSKEHAFCLYTLKNKLPLTAQNFVSLVNPQLIAITARQNPNRNTFEIQIKKRKRGPNKKYTIWTNTRPQINSQEI